MGVIMLYITLTPLEGDRPVYGCGSPVNSGFLAMCGGVTGDGVWNWDIWGKTTHSVSTIPGPDRLRDS